MQKKSFGVLYFSGCRSKDFELSILALDHFYFCADVASCGYFLQYWKKCTNGVRFFNIVKVIFVTR